MKKVEKFITYDNVSHTSAVNADQHLTAIHNKAIQQLLHAWPTKSRTGDTQVVRNFIHDNMMLFAQLARVEEDRSIEK